MKINREPLFPNGLSDENVAVLSEFLHALASDCDSRYFVQLRRYYARQETLGDPDHPWKSPPPD